MAITPMCKKTKVEESPSKMPICPYLHVDGCHWIVISNVRPENGVVGLCLDATVIHVYDSRQRRNIACGLPETVCSFLVPPVEAVMINIEGQRNTFDCGVLAIASATELAHGQGPVLCSWDTSRVMRDHLLSCLENGHMTRFPTTRRRRVGLGKRVRKSIKENVYCDCMMPNDKDKPMIQCDFCKKWFHLLCVELEEKCYDNVKWTCSHCTL